MKNSTRYIVFFIIVFIIFGFILLLLPQDRAAISTARFTVVIDAGHGGFDGGAVGRLTGVKEDGLNLIVANKVKSLFEKNGVAVVMTRPDENALGRTKNEDMAKRRSVIENADADIVISIHMNKFNDTTCSGPVTFYHEESEEGKVLAELIQTELNTRLAPPRPREQKPETYYILRSSDSPCVLVECGFISNEREEKLLQTEDYQNECAKAIYTGAKLYLEQSAASSTGEPSEQ